MHSLTVQYGVGGWKGGDSGYKGSSGSNRRDGGVTVVRETCCFNNTLAEEGEVVLILPAKCIQLVCHNGYLVQHLVGDTNCML